MMKRLRQKIKHYKYSMINVTSQFKHMANVSMRASLMEYVTE